jgi:hypothetical protein
MFDLTNDNMTWILYRAAYGTAEYLREVHPDAEAEMIREAVFRLLGDDECEPMELGISDALDGRRPVSVECLQAICPRAGIVGAGALS